MLKNCLSIWAIFRGGRSWFRGGRTPKIFRASRDNLFRASRDTLFRASRDFLGGGEPQNFFRASREIFFRATRETNLGLRPPLKNLQEISPPPRKNPDYALGRRPNKFRASSDLDRDLDTGSFHDSQHIRNLNSCIDLDQVFHGVLIKDYSPTKMGSRSRSRHVMNLDTIIYTGIWMQLRIQWESGYGQVIINKNYLQSWIGTCNVLFALIWIRVDLKYANFCYVISV